MTIKAMNLWAIPKVTKTLQIYLIGYILKPVTHCYNILKSTGMPWLNSCSLVRIWFCSMVSWMRKLSLWNSPVWHFDQDSNLWQNTRSVSKKRGFTELKKPWTSNTSYKTTFWWFKCRWMRNIWIKFLLKYSWV